MTASLVISWESRRLILLAGTASGADARVENITELDWPPGSTPREGREAAAQLLKETLRRQGLTQESALVSLPRETVVLRHLHLPDLPDDELPEIVRLQAAMKSAVPPDQILIDFLPLPGVNKDGLRPVLIATIDRKNSQLIRETLLAAGLKLEGISVESIGLAELAARAVTAAYGKTLVAASLSDHRLELLFLQNDNLLMMHTAVLAAGGDLDKGVIAEINRATIALEQKVGPATIGGVILFTDLKQDFPQLGARYGEEFRLIGPGEAPGVRFSGPVVGNLTNTAGALAGLLLNRASGRLPGLDFIHPRRKSVAQDNRLKKYGPYAAAGAAVLLLCLYGYFSYRGKLDRQIAELSTRQTELNGLLSRGKPTLDSSAELGRWQDRDLDLLAEIDLMQSTLPGTDAAYLEQFRYDVAIGNQIAKYTGKGVARNRDVVFNLYAEFGKLGFAVAPQEIKTGRNPDAEYPMVFDLMMDRLPGQSGPASTPTPTAPPQSPR
jgi:hypothetical protein